MLLTISTTHQPAMDLGYLLHKNPARLQTEELSFGKGFVFYSEASFGRKPKSKGLFTPAARASFKTDLGSSLHPSRIQSVTSSPLEDGRLDESSMTSLRGCREVPCCSETGFRACFAASRSSSARLELMRWSSLRTAAVGRPRAGRVPRHRRHAD